MIDGGIYTGPDGDELYGSGREVEDDYYEGEYEGSERYCWDCGGRGWKITCPDDLCHGNDECIHGDPPTRCWTCNRDGSREDWL